MNGEGRVQPLATGGLIPADATPPLVGDGGCIVPGRGLSGGEPVVIDRMTFVRLVKVAEHVSRGKRAALDGLYPDATARFALGALHEAGLLPFEAAPDA